MSCEQASLLMEEGIRLLYSDNDPHAALLRFDRALELRRRLPAQVPMHAYDLAACWLNRAEALTRLGSEYHALAIRAYDEALALLHTLPPGEDARFLGRLAIAQQNRALLLPRADGIAALLDAIAIAERAAMPPRERDQLLAAAWLNLAIVGAKEEDARRALNLVKPLEHEDAVSAEIGIKSRYVLCRILAGRLSDNRDSEDVHEATDLAEEGLGLARDWDQRGVGDFRGLASDLFRFGARVYARYQPHFLGEFLSEQAELWQESAAAAGATAPGHRVRLY